jgi:hypothetical protein
VPSCERHLASVGRDIYVLRCAVMIQGGVGAKILLTHGQMVEWMRQIWHCLTSELKIDYRRVNSRVVAHSETGSVTASLMLRKLGCLPTSERAVTLRELGKIERTLFLLPVHQQRRTAAAASTSG